MTRGKTACFVVGGALAWALAIHAGWSSTDGASWSRAPETRGNSVNIAGRAVETTAEHEDRQTGKRNELREDLGRVRRAMLGDRRDTRGNDIRPPPPIVPRGFAFSVREACERVKLDEPERYANVDCMDARYDEPDPWWQAGGSQGR
jgi:hypothetical protein